MMSKAHSLPIAVRLELGYCEEVGQSHSQVQRTSQLQSTCSESIDNAFPENEKLVFIVVGDDYWKLQRMIQDKPERYHFCSVRPTI